MFGFDAPELIILFVVLIIVYAVTNTNKAPAMNYPARKCLSCGFEGQMNTWLRNYSLPQFITLILLLFWLIPGLIFIAWGWGKYKCPRCNSLGKNMILDNPNGANSTIANETKCPYCAETVKTEAIICKHCHQNIVK